MARQRVEFVTYTTGIASAINIGISAYLLLHGYGIVSLLIAFVVTQWTIALIYLFFITRYVSPLRWEFDLGFARRLVHEIRAFAGLALVAGVFARPEVIILSLISTDAQIGYYSAALKIITLWSYVPRIYMTNVFPVLSRSYHVADQRAQLIQEKSVKYLLAVSLPLTAGLIVGAEQVIGLLYGPGFGPSATALRLLALNIPLTAILAVFWRSLVARGAQASVLRALAISTVAELVTGYLLISRWASLGAAINTPAISILYVVLLALYVRQDGTQVDFLKLGWRFGLASLGMALVVWPLEDRIHLWLLGLVAVLVYAVLVVVLRAFSDDDLALFRQIWRVRGAGRRTSELL